MLSSPSRLGERPQLLQTETLKLPKATEALHLSFKNPETLN